MSAILLCLGFFVMVWSLGSAWLHESIRGRHRYHANGQAIASVALAMGFAVACLATSLLAWTLGL